MTKYNLLPFIIITIIIIFFQFFFRFYCVVTIYKNLYNEIELFLRLLYILYIFLLL